MNEKIDKITHSRVFMTILIISLMLLVTITGTYAWFTWRSTENTELTMTIGKLVDVIFNNGNDINANLTPVYNYYDGVNTTFSINNRSTDTMVVYKIKLNITSIDTELISNQVKYTLVKNDSIVSSGDFSNVSNGTPIELSVASLINGTTNYKFYIYLDGNEENDSSMIGKSIVGNITLDASESSNVLTETIGNLYTASTLSTVTNNSIEYNYASSASLMNDRLGGTTSDYNAGNIRYYGANPNNYIDIGDVYEADTTFNNWELVGWSYDNQAACYDDFDCDSHYADWGYDTAAECTAAIPDWLDGTGYSTVDEVCGTTTIPKGTPRLYRIIGLFKGVELADGSKKDLIKVVRDEPIGYYSWDTSDSAVNSGSGINEWSQADLMKLLNPGYESETVGGSLWWNSGSGVCYNAEYNSTTSCDFTGKGLSSNVQNKIASVVWNTGGWNDNPVYSNQIYSYERGTNVISNPSDGITRTTSWIGKVALMYPSDYGYATDFSNCSSNLYEYYTDGCYNTDWLYDDGPCQWLLTPYSSDADGAWRAHDGYVNGGYAFNGYAVRPVFYLNSEAIIVSGNGTESNPYVIG